jgi:HK97 family phage major capsid protein
VPKPTISQGDARELAGAVGKLAEAVGEVRQASVDRDQVREMIDTAVAAEQSGERGYQPTDSEQQTGTLLGYEARALVGGSGSGSYVVPDDYLGTVWDRLAESSVAIASGMTVIDTDSDTLHVPKLTADASAAWTAEGGTITAADPTLSEEVATPRKLAALVQLSNEVIADSNPAILDVVSANLIRSLGLKLDLGIFEGSGTPPEITGMGNVSNISEIEMAANGAAFTDLDQFAQAIGTLAENDATATAIVMPPRTWSDLLELKEQTTGSNKPLLQQSAGSGSQGVERRLYGIPVWLTSQLAIDESQGTASDASSVYVYEAAESIVVRRSGIRVEVDRSRLFNTDQSEVRAISRFDLVVPNPKSIVRIKGVIPA